MFDLGFIGVEKKLSSTKIIITYQEGQGCELVAE